MRSCTRLKGWFTALVLSVFFLSSASAGTPVLDEDFEGTFPPTGWTTVDDSVDPLECEWLRSDDYNMGGGVTWPSLGAATDSDDCATGANTFGDVDTSLLTPALDLTGLSDVELTFDLAYRHLGSSHVDVDVSTDGGTSWTTLTTYNASVGGATPPLTPEPQSIDLSAYDGEPSVTLRWRYVAGFDWWVFIDNVVVAEGVPAGDGELAVDPAILDFGDVHFGTSVAMDITVSNDAVAGSGSIELDAITSSGDAEFAISGGDCAAGTVLAPQASCTVEVTFSPAAEDDYTGQVEVTTVDSQSETVDLTGSGIEPPDLPVANITPDSFVFNVDLPLGDSDTLTIGNTGIADLIWEVVTDEADAGAPVLNSHDPALDEAIDIPNFTLTGGGTSESFTIPAGVATRGDVIGFSFEGTIAGVSGTGSWASDMCMIIEAPDGTTYGVGGISGTVPECGNTNSWDFQGGGSTDDGTYESEHDDVFAPPLADQGDWTFTFIDDWTGSTATMNWTDVTVTLHKQPLPFCQTINSPDWLDVDTLSGTTPPAGSDQVQVSVDSSTLSHGTYEGAVCVTTNDPDNELVIVPVTLNVTDTTLGDLEGTVTSAGHCEANPHAVSGATITAVGDDDTVFTTTTGADGSYSFIDQLSDTENDWEISVEADGYFGDSESVTIIAGDTVTLGFDLTLDAPCATADPDSFVFDLILGEDDDDTLTIGNVDGAAVLNWDVLDAVGARNVSESQERSQERRLARQVIWHQAPSLEAERGELPRGGDLIWDQGSTGTAGIVSDVFHNHPQGTVGVYSADDFLIASDQFIAEIFTGGFWAPDFFPPGVENAVAITWYIYPDAGGVPAGHPEDGLNLHAWTITLAPDDPAITIEADGNSQDIRLDVVEAQGQTIALGSGRFWLIVAPEINYDGVTLNNRWNWHQGVPAEEPSKLIDPNNLFGAGATTWTNFADLGVAWRDMAFTLLGGPPPVDCWDPAEISWLDVTPTNGSVDPGQSQTVDIDVNTAGLTQGTYEAAICVYSNDTANSLIPVPVTLNVIDPDAGLLEGTVSGGGYCGTDPQPLAGAMVTIVGANNTFEVMTDADGHYSIPINSGESPVDIAVSAAGHLDGTATGVVITAGVTTTEDFELVLDAPCATVDPEIVEAEVGQGGTTNRTLTIDNQAGGADLEWTIHEAETEGFRGGPIDLVADGGFEGGTPNPDWDEEESTFGTPLCDAGCGLGGGTGPHSGSWWAWFGGVTSATTGSVAQNITFPDPGTAELRFWLEIPASGQPGFLEVSLGGDVLFSVTEADAGSYATYTEVVIDVSAYADGGTHELRFDSATQAGAAVTNFFVDDVSLLFEPVLAGCAVPTDVPWLSVSPSSGTAPAGGTSAVTVHFDASGLALGDYEALLCVNSNDSATPRIEVPVLLSVLDLPPGELELSPSTLDFGTIEVGDTANSPLTLTNVGEDTFPVLVDSILVTGAAFADTGNGSCQAGTTELASGESCTIEVAFTPTAESTFSGSVVVDGANGKLATAMLSGTGGEVTIEDPIFSDRFEAANE